MNKKILADGRFQGTHGIGRFSHEVLSRLQNTEILTKGPKPLSWQNLFWLPHKLQQIKNNYQVYFNPGFNPTFSKALPIVFTIHDLTHLYLPGKHALLKKIYYETLIKKAAKNAAHIITVSEYSKKTIIDWANLPADKITVVGNGISKHFKPEGDRFQPGFSYLLHVGNTKAHKNVARLIEAFATAKIDNSIHLILTGENNATLQKLIQQYHLTNRVHFQTNLSDEKLATLYRGASAFCLPSLYEGFGIPLLEAMACGVPIITSNITSLPEVASDAALLIDPYQVESIRASIEKIFTDATLRNTLIAKGFQQVKNFSWDKTASKVQKILEEIEKH